MTDERAAVTVVDYSGAHREEMLDRSHQRIREAGMRMVMVETCDDPGHAPARAVYRANGYKRWPVARYFKDLTG